MQSNHRINLLIDYPISGSTDYRGLAFPPVLWSALQDDDRFNVYSSLEKAPKHIDIVLIISAGSHRGLRDMDLHSISLSPFVKEAYARYPILKSVLGRTLGLKKVNYYDRLLLPHREYEKRVRYLKNKYKNAKFIHRLAGSYSNIGKNYGYDKSIKTINKLCDVTIHQSNYSRILWEEGVQTIFGRGVLLQPKRSLIIPNGVNTNIFSREGDTIDLPGEIRILHVSASPNPRKGLSTVLEIANLLKENKKFVFFLIGNQANDPVCGSDISEFQNVVSIGPVMDREKLASYYRSVSIFLYPSIHDCSPNVILEAMASGLPIITEDSGGNGEMIRKTTINGGVFLRKKNPVFAMQTVLENIDTLRNGALSIIDNNYRMETMKERYTALFLETLSHS